MVCSWIGIYQKLGINFDTLKQRMSKGRLVPWKKMLHELFLRGAMRKPTELSRSERV